jgi:golgin subfamily B member 1
MRTALLFAPQSLESEVASIRPTEGGAEWLAGVLQQWGYTVVRAAGAGALGELERVLADVGQDDTLLVHVTAELRDAVTLEAGEDDLGLGELDRLVQKGGARAFVLAELTYSRGSEDALALAEDVSQIRSALAQSSALVAVHGRAHGEGGAQGEESLPFTRLAVRAATELFEDGREEVLATDIVERLREMPESHAVARSYTFLRGASDFDVARLTDAVLDAPDFDLLVDLADRARDVGAMTHAIAGYRALLLASADERSRGIAYERMAGAFEATGRTGRARRAYKKAIANNPRARGLHDALIRLETEQEAWPSAIAAMQERLELIDSPAERVEELFAIARLTLEKLRDFEGAVKHLEAARALDGDNEDVLEALRRSYRVLKSWPELIDVTGALAERAPTGAERAARRFAQAQIARKHLEDADATLGFLLAALEDDATHDEALDDLCAMRAARQEEPLLERELSSVLQRLLTDGEDERATDLARRIASLETPPSRQEAPSGSVPVVREPAKKAETTQEITPDQMMGLDDEDELSEAELESEIARAPLTAKNHAALFTIHMRAGQTDRAYLSALALEELGAVDGEVNHILEQCRPSGLRVRAALDTGAWRLLRAPGSDDVLEGLVRAIGRAAGVTRAEERKAKGRQLVLDEARRQPETSTASIVRTFHWAAEILGVDCPELYLLDRVPGDVVAVPSGHPDNAPRTAMGPSVLSGLSTIDLAFLCSRHLTYYRPEYSALIDYPTLGEMSLLVLAALQVALPAMPVPSNVEGVVSHLRSGLARHLTPEEREAMNVAVLKLDARGGRVNLQAWIRSVELTATRVGLLLAGDLRAAMSRIRNEERMVSELSAESKRIDLLGFCETPELAELRERFWSPITLRPRRESGMMTRADVGSREWASAVEIPVEQVG